MTSTDAFFESEQITLEYTWPQQVGDGGDGGEWCQDDHHK